MENYDQKRHYALGVYCVYILIISSLYDLSLEIIGHLDHVFSSTVFVTSIAMLFFLVFFILMIRQTGYPLSLFGFTTRNWFKYSVESILFSIVFCALLTLLKWYLITHIPIFESLHLFKDYGNHISGLDLLIPILYILFTPLQVFMTQGAIQSPLLEFLPIANRAWISVIVSTLLFSAFHVELNIIFALSVMIPGVCWAIMYLRHRTLISIIISHSLIGVWAFAILDFRAVFNTAHCSAFKAGISTFCQ